MTKLKPRGRAERSLRQQLLGDAWQAGDLLPSERDLAASASVSRFTMHSALLALQRDGLVEPAGPRGWRKLGTVAAVSGRSQAARSIVVLSPWIAAGLNEIGKATTGRLLLGMAEAATAAGRHLLHASIGTELPELSPGRVDGLVVLHPAQRDPRVAQAIAQAMAHHLPVAAEDEDSAALSGCDVVASDHASGGRLIGTWAAAQGCRSLLRLQDPPHSGPPHPWLRVREEAIAAACAAHGISCPEPLRVTMPITGASRDEFDARVRLMQSHLSEFLAHSSVDAIAGVTDRTAMVVGEVLRRLGITAQCIGYDDIWSRSPEYACGAEPPAATVDKLDMEIGRTLIETVLERQRSGPAAARQVRLVVPKLLERSRLHIMV